MENTTDIENVNLAVKNDSDMDGKFLTFLSEQQIMAIPISDVVQIVGIQTISDIPDSVPYMKGVINLRGSIIPVIDIRLRLGKNEKTYDERTCIIVVSIDEKEIGFIVDEVDAVVAITEENISIPPTIAGSTNKSYLSGIAKLDSKVVLIIDTSKILSDDMLSHLQQQT